MKVVLVSAVMALAALAGARAYAQSPLLGPLNDAVNALLGAAGAPNTSASAVVPIVSNAGAQMGYAQVTGTGSAVSRVRAVLLLRAPSAAGWSISALVPVSTVSRGGTIHRVSGASVDALINYGG